MHLQEEDSEVPGEEVPSAETEAEAEAEDDGDGASASGEAGDTIREDSEKRDEITQRILNIMAHFLEGEVTYS